MYISLAVYNVIRLALRGLASGVHMVYISHCNIAFILYMTTNATNFVCIHVLISPVC